MLSDTIFYTTFYSCSFGQFVNPQVKTIEVYPFYRKSRIEIKCRLADHNDINDSKYLPSGKTFKTVPPTNSLKESEKLQTERRYSQYIQRINMKNINDSYKSIRKKRKIGKKHE